ncbi:PQQ-dependent sugar dehydrogenase [Croceicoccus sp. F390]|uniref:PQQ-dependent sugar dehydrogenase n=1 Tax=Croceicoccus esteveae TaxID=3075597 RepID=A0ABU2ZHD5_9SPHN|nr:PQQ-dependent sugar dehydrogenase [Croceicoccus sp. F390]MDT0575009.1 PQQ-dependent sugar dehydrogenase [Croceicoccus sp. F390]
MIRSALHRPALLLVLPLLLGGTSVASCSSPSRPVIDDEMRMGAGEQQFTGFARENMGTFDEPWAMAFEPGTGNLFITEREGAIRIRQPDGTISSVSGVPAVDYGGQGGLGDLVFAPDYLQSGAVYLSWAEAGPADTRGAVVGRAILKCEEDRASGCRLDDLKVIWRQEPKVTGRAHYSHRIAFSPDGNYLFITSGERQKKTPAQDLSNTLGTIVRLLPDGTPAPGNPFAGRGGPAAQIWSYGHRNMLGIGFDPAGQLWTLEHGPKGGDELNLVERGANYGWPIVSNGIDYDGGNIPDHSTRPEFNAPDISWDPVIAPGNFIFYTGTMFPALDGQAIIAGLKTQNIVTVGFDSGTPVELSREPMGARIREVAQAADGAIWAVEDGKGAKLWRLTPKR